MQEAYYFANSFHVVFWCISAIDIGVQDRTQLNLTSANILLAISSINNLAQVWVLQFFVIVISYCTFKFQK